MAEFPGEPEVLEFGKAYGGNLAKGIPAGIPDEWLQAHWGWRTFEEQFWPKDWKRALVWRFEIDWVNGHPKARGGIKKNEKPAAGNGQDRGEALQLLELARLRKDKAMEKKMEGVLKND